MRSNEVNTSLPSKLELAILTAILTVFASGGQPNLGYAQDDADSSHVESEVGGRTGDPTLTKESSDAGNAQSPKHDDDSHTQEDVRSDREREDTTSNEHDHNGKSVTGDRKDSPATSTLVVGLAGGVAGSLLTILLAIAIWALLRALKSLELREGIQAEEDRADERRMVQNYILAFSTSCLVVTCVWIAIVTGMWFFWGNAETAGMFGDSAGFANTWFSGLAFAGVIVTLFMQMKELAFQRRELTANTAALNQAAEAQDKTQLAMHQQLTVATKTVQLQAYTFLADFHYRIAESKSAKSIPQVRQKAEDYANKAAAVLQEISSPEGNPTDTEMRVEIPTKIADGLAFLKDVLSKTEKALSNTSTDSSNNNVASQTINKARSRLQKWIEDYGDEFDVADLEEVSKCIGVLNNATDKYHRRPNKVDSTPTKRAWDEYWSNLETAIEKLRETVEMIRQRNDTQ